jgi:hypothetical protein
MILLACAVADPGGMGGIHPPHRPQTPGPRKKFYVKTANFFGALRRLLFN